MDLCAGCCVNCVCKRSHNGDECNLADALCAVRAGRERIADKVNMELIVGGAVHEGWDLVVTVVAVYYAALIVYHDLLKDCLAETHGKCALDLAFACLTQAVETIMGNLAAAPPAFAPAPKAPKEKVLLLPQVNRSATHAVEYLHRRGIDYELIDFCIKTGRLYESYPYHNVVFVGMDADGKPRYANQRGIGSDFIGDANGSDKHYSFGIPAVAASDTLHMFESAVDLLSYGTLQKLDSKDWRSENLLSLAGVYKPRAKIEESSLPAALVRYLSEHPHIRRVVLRLDNDATGRIAAETIKTLLPRKYAVTVDIQPPPQGKDYNDCLCMRLGLPITKRRERSKER